MSNGLGAGFLAVTLLAVVGGLAVLVVLATVAAAAYRRRTGRVPTRLRYPLAAIGVGVFGVAGFGVLVLIDEAPAAAALFASIVVVPLLLVGSYLARTTRASRLDVVAATATAWGGPFLLGAGVAFGVLTGLDAALGLAPAESRRLGVAWIAAAAGGLVVVLGMVAIGSRLLEMTRAATATSAGG